MKKNWLKKRSLGVKELTLYMADPGFFLSTTNCPLNTTKSINRGYSLKDSKLCPKTKKEKKWWFFSF